MNASTAMARVLVDELIRGGVRHAVIAPGSRSAALAMALHADERVAVHVEIDERSAGFLAVGIGKASGRPAVVVTTSGTAVANLLPAVIEADAAAVPLLVCSADRPPELQDTGANQTIDQHRIFGGRVRAFTDVGVAEDRPGAAVGWRSVTARALARARGAGEGPPGPVHLNVGFREPLVPDAGGFAAPVDGREDGRPWTTSRPAPRQPAPADIEELAGLLGRRGVLVLGDGTDPDPWLRLGEAARWPVLAEPLSGGRRQGTIGAYDLLLRCGDFAGRHRPDVAVVAGRAALSKSLRAWLDGIPQVLVDPWGRWHDPDRAACRVVAADAGLLVAEVLRAGGDGCPADWLGGWHDAEARARAAIDAVLDADEEPSEPRTARDLAAALTDGSALVVASSMPVRDLDLVMAPRGPLDVLGNRGASGIDGFVSTALGAAIARRDGPAAGETAALAGDLSLLHDQNGLLLDNRPDLAMVVVNNDGGAIFSFLPQARFPDGFERLFTTPHGRDLARLAEVHGCGHTRLGRASALGEALDAAQDAGGVQLIEVRTDRDANLALHHRLTEAVAAAVSGGSRVG